MDQTKAQEMQDYLLNCPPEAKVKMFEQICHWFPPAGVKWTPEAAKFWEAMGELRF